MGRRLEDFEAVRVADRERERLAARLMVCPAVLVIVRVSKFTLDWEALLEEEEETEGVEEDDMLWLLVGDADCDGEREGDCDRLADCDGLGDCVVDCDAD